VPVEAACLHSVHLQDEQTLGEGHQSAEAASQEACLVVHRPFQEVEDQTAAYQVEEAFQASNRVEEGKEDAFQAEVLH
jgi:hypothetical protein